MALTEGEMRVMRYIDMGLGAYHLVVTNRERGTRGRIVRSLSWRQLINGGTAGKPWSLTDEGRTRYERQRGPEK